MNAKVRFSVRHQQDRMTCSHQSAVRGAITLQMTGLSGDVVLDASWAPPRCCPTPLAVLPPSINLSLSQHPPSLCQCRCSSSALLPLNPNSLVQVSCSLQTGLFPVSFFLFGILFLFSLLVLILWPVSLPLMIYHSAQLVQLYMCSVVFFPQLISFFW